MDSPPSAQPPEADPGSAGASPERVGLLAGGGRFPVLVAENLRRRGIEVVCAGLRYQAFPELAGICSRFRLFGLGRLGSVIRYFRSEGIRELTWAGWIRKEEIYRPFRWLSILPDWRMIRLYFRKVPDRQNQTLLAALADEFESEGISVSHSAKYCPELLAEEGVLSRRRPSKEQLADIAFGWKLAKRMADLDVGQSVAVSERSTLAVEALEGTDRNIRRAGEFYKRGGFTVVKLAKDGHDMRFDVPAIGPDTIRSMHEAGAAVLAIEAGKTLILDREETIRHADEHGIVIVAFRDAPRT